MRVAITFSFLVFCCSSSLTRAETGDLEKLAAQLRDLDSSVFGEVTQPKLKSMVRDDLRKRDE